MAGTEVRTRGERGPEGKAEVRILKEEIRIIAEDGTTYTIAKDRVADGVKLIAGRDVYFRLNAAEDMLYDLRPWSGTFFVKFIGFSKQRDAELPEPSYDPGGERRKRKDGQPFVTRPRYWFTALFEIVNGPFEGVRLSRFYDYRWEETEEGLARCVALGDRGKDAYTFYTTFGYDFANDSMSYKKNLLPELEKTLKIRRKIASATVEAGKTASLGPVPEGALPARRSPKKASTKRAAPKRR